MRLRGKSILKVFRKKRDVNYVSDVVPMKKHTEIVLWTISLVLLISILFFYVGTRVIFEV